jgi:hypothetical protein
MQNRSMFPYRRHGPKKRPKNGPGRKPRGPQKGLPNSARDLLPLLQPATKALAHMLAGRTAMSGQFEHARGLLGQAERLVAERVHNRLNPVEREEFFEQLARLKLTLADAEAEAEVRAVEQHAPRRPPAPPIARERLKEMALALTTPETPRQLSGAAPEEPTLEPEADIEHDIENKHHIENMEEPAAAPSTGAIDNKLRMPTTSADEPRPMMLGRRPRRLELSKGASDAARAVAAARDHAARVRHSRAPAPDQAKDQAAPAGNGPVDQAGADLDEADNGSTAHSEQRTRAKSLRRSRKTQEGLPEGWIIDDEGFVVPGHG